jgi:hypothetical protein
MGKYLGYSTELHGVFHRAPQIMTSVKLCANFVNLCVTASNTQSTLLNFIFVLKSTNH